MARNKRVLILGAGSAGLSAAAELGRMDRGDRLEVTLVDQHNYHLFLPLLYQVASGGVEAGHICFPVRSVLRGLPVSFRESQVLGIDLQARRVNTDDGELDWDYLVIALGSTTSFFGLADVQRHALCLKTLQDGIAIYNRILDCYEAAVLEPDPERRRRLLTFVVVGGGATGIEFTAALQDFMRKVLVRDYPQVPLDDVRLIMAEARGSVLPGIHDSLAGVALKHLRAGGTEVLLNTAVVKASPDSVELSNGRSIPCHTLVWTAGVRPVPVVEALPLPKARDGRLTVQPTLELGGTDGVYLLGDCAYFPRDAAEALPPTGQVAVQQGVACARNILEHVNGRPQSPFRYRHGGDLLSLGRNVAVAQLGKRAFDGFPAWLVWRVVYLNKLMGFKNRLSVLLDWSFAYFYRSNTSRLE